MRSFNVQCWLAGKFLNSLCTLQVVDRYKLGVALLTVARQRLARIVLAAQDLAKHRVSCMLAYQVITHYKLHFDSDAKFFRQSHWMRAGEVIKRCEH